MSDTGGRDVAEPAPKGVKIAAKALAAVAGASIGGPLGAAVGAASSDALVELAERSWNELRAARAESVLHLLQSAADAADLDPEELVCTTQFSREGQQLFLDAVAAASETILLWKVEALAKALANGLADDLARVDEERLVIGVLSDVEAPHIRALAVLARVGVPMEQARLAGASGLSDAGPVVAVLVRHGLIEEPRREGLTLGGGPPSYEMLPFGQAVLEYLG